MTTDEKLILLVEECGEVIQAATKCLRFGYMHHQPDYGVNSRVLAMEVGDLLGVIDSLPLDLDVVKHFRTGKMEKAERVKREFVCNE